MVMGTRQMESLVKECYRSGIHTIKDALQFFDRLLAAKSPGPSIYSFNHLFTALTRMKNSNNHYATVFSLFNRWTQNRQVSSSPDICTYCILIAYCIRMNRPKLGLVFLGQFIKSRQRADARIFNPLLKGLCSDNRISEAVAMVFNKMPKLGCTPDVISYSTVIDGLCKEGAISNAFSLFDRMQSEGIVPNVITYNSLINGLCKEGDTEMAEEQMSNMVSHGLKPNVVTYNTLVDGLCKKGLLDKALEMLQSMVSNGHDPNVVTYNTIINAQCKVGEIENAEELLHEMISIGKHPNVQTYNIIIHGLCKMNKITEAKESLNEMVSKGIVPNTATYTIIDRFTLQEGGS